MDMRAIEALRAARAKIERGWCQHECALDEDGRLVDCYFSTACQWAVDGALRAVSTDYGYSVWRAQVYLGFATGSRGSDADIITWNDAPGRTKEEVLAAFDRAIMLAERNYET